ncbi:MAG: translation initiation factor eIF5 [Amphiamblys sp. WSBS2006]|nr:MAG: translation initiation factor eIF5 [Amphiamblys sp. WSBS2006]
MGMINILRENTDAHYRYKMPSLTTKTEGRGNGIKTALPNIQEVAKALARPTTYITRFFGAELGTNSLCDEKNRRFLINGVHTQEELLELLYVFIEKFVLCPRCKNPETEIAAAKKTLTRKCSACGETSAVDPAHKLSAYILRNPPQTAEKTATKKTTGEQASEDKYIRFSQEIEKNTTDDDIAHAAALLNIRRDRAISVFVQTILKPCLVDRLAKRIFLLQQWIETDADTSALLGGVERVAAKNKDRRSGLIPAVLQLLFTHEIVDEETLAHWKQTYNTSYVSRQDALENRHAARIFFEWLENSD